MGGAGLQKFVLRLVLVALLVRSGLTQTVFTSAPSDVVVVLGQPARFDCGFTASTPVSITWQRGDGSAISPSAKYTFLLNSSLLIEPTEDGDQGLYTCVVSEQFSGNSIQGSASLGFALIVRTFLASPESQTVDEGNSVLLFCTQAGSLPPATITWRHNNQTVTPSSRVFISSSVLEHTDPPQVTSSLGIAAILPSDSGEYRCEATNSLLPGAVTSGAASLSVRASPQAPAITQNPSDVILESFGQTALFTCFVNGEPPPDVIWLFNGTPLDESQQITVQSQDGRSTLTMSNVQSNEVGAYQCRAESSEGSATSTPAQLQLASISTVFELQPQNSVGIIGLSGRLDCQAPLSIPPAAISWTREFAQLTDPRFSTLQNGSLLVSDLRLEDQASYFCTATNPRNSISRTSNPATITAIGQAFITPSLVTVEMGQSATFSCSAQGDPPAEITWYRGANQITPATPRVTLTPDNNTLTISNVLFLDQGYYLCRAVFQASSTEGQAFLNVLSPPIFQEASISLSVLQHSPLTLPCSVFQDPTTTFSWELQGQTLDTAASENNLLLLANGSLFISNVTLDLEGSFTCVASNPLGTAQGTVSVDVLVPPAVSVESAVVTVTTGMNATLRCFSLGDPVPIWSWTRNGTVVPSPATPTYRLEGGGSVLVIVGVGEGDEGTFQCSASSPAGTDQDSITLSVLVPANSVATPTTLQLAAGSTALFDCLATGDPAPQLRWLNSASIDVTLLGDPRVIVHSNGSLVISSVESGDQQQYICEVINEAGTDLSLVSLIVMVAPQVTIAANTTAIQGNSLTLDCNVIGQPRATVVWTRGNDGSPVPLQGRITQDTDGRLFFSTIFSTDEAVYNCTATNSIGAATAETYLTVLVVPVIQVSSVVVVVLEGETAVLGCLATGTPTPEVTWFRDSVPLPNPALPHIQLASNNSLVVGGALRGDAGVYICRASNRAGTESATVQLRVNVPPVVMATVAAVTAIQGDNLTLTCIAIDGNPVPIWSWTRNGTVVPSLATPTYRLEGGGSVLVIVGVGEGDEGTFQCSASSPAGTDQDSITLSVLVPPSFSELATNSVAVEGTAHTLTCSARGDPPPAVTWLRNDIIVSAMASLLLDPVTRGDAGTYTCVASNSVGSVSGDVELDVQFTPSILQSPTSTSVPLNGQVEFTCVADGNPSPQISWVFNGAAIEGVQGSPYTITMVTAASDGEYTCVASNSVGFSSASAVLTVLFPPSAPVITIVMATSPSSITVQWAASADDGGSPITAYLVQYRSTAAQDMTFDLVEVTSSEFTVDVNGLVPFTEYEVRVRARNLVGVSEQSSTLEALTHPEAPVAPGNFRVLSATLTTLSLAWEQPNPLNGMFAAYDLLYGEEADFEATLRSRLVFIAQFTVTGLEVGVVYRVQVRASTVSLTGQSLWGPYSTLLVQDGVVVEVVTEPPITDTPSPSPSPSPTTPSPPTTSVAEETTSTTIVDETTSVTTETQTSVVTETETSTSSGTEVPSTSISSQPSPITTSTTLTPSPSPQPDLLPSAPRQVSVNVLQGGDTIVVTWLPPAQSNGLLLDYRVLVLLASSGQLSASRTIALGLEDQDDLQFVVVTGLTVDLSQYSITVSASNAAGRGMESDPVIVGMDVLVSDLTSEVVPSTTSEEVVATTTTSDDVATTTTSSTLLTTSSASPTPVRQSPIPETQIPIPTVVEPGQKDEVYYIIRIVPPVVGGLIIILVVVMTIAFCVHMRASKVKRKGQYQFSELGNEAEQHNHQLRMHEGEQVVATDDLQANSYYATSTFKEAFNSNFSYATSDALPTKQDSDVDEPDNETDSDDAGGPFHFTSPVGRDAMQEFPSRPESEDVTLATDSRSLDSPAVGKLRKETDLGYASRDDIRARKSKGRSAKGKAPGADVGLSSGGIMETRIGAVGGFPSDQMY